MSLLDPSEMCTPRAGVPEGHTFNHCYQVLVGLLLLTESLGVITKGQTHRSTQGFTEGFPDLQYKLGATNGHDAGGDSMEI